MYTSQHYVLHKKHWFFYFVIPVRYVLIGENETAVSIRLKYLELMLVWRTNTVKSWPLFVRSLSMSIGILPNIIFWQWPKHFIPQVLQHFLSVEEMLWLGLAHTFDIWLTSDNCFSANQISHFMLRVNLKSNISYMSSKQCLSYRKELKMPYGMIRIS